MSWKFPKHPVKNNRVPDADAMNENFLSPGQELVGKLNEHNFRANTFAATQIHPSAAFVYHTASGINNYIPYNMGPSTYNSNDDTHSNFLFFAETSDWVELSDSVLTFSSPACTAYIHASAQVYTDRTASIVSISRPQPQLAIKIDGAVIPETITGGTEPDQDRYLGAFARAAAFPAVTTITIPLPSGAHRISIVLRSIGPIEEQGSRVGSNELICLEMRA